MNIQTFRIKQLNQADVLNRCHVLHWMDAAGTQAPAGTEQAREPVQSYCGMRL